MKSKLIKTEIVLPLPETISLTAAVEQERNELVLKSAEFKSVTTTAQSNSVAEAARELRTYAAAVMAAGKEKRAPLRALFDRVKTVEDDHLAPVLAEQKRLEAIQKTFLDAEQARVERDEEERLAKIAEAEEEARKAAEALADKPDSKRAIKSEEKAQVALQIATAPVSEAHKASGQAVRKVNKWKVTDEQALFKARPELFKVEVKPSAINAVCFPNSMKASETNPDTTSVPGLSLWYETAVSTKKFR